MDDPNKENEIQPPQIDEKPPAATRAELAQELPPEPPITPERPRGRSASGLLENTWFKAIASSVAAVVVIVYALMPMFGGGSYVTKQDFESNISNISVTLNEAIGNLNAKTTELDDAINNLPNTVKSEVTSALATQLATVNQQVADVVSDVSQYDSIIESLKSNSTTALQQNAELREDINALITELDEVITLVASLEAEVAVLVEEETTSPSNVPVTAVIRQQTNYLMVNETDNVSYGVMRMTIENTSDKELTDIVIGLYFNCTTIPTTGTVIGGMLPWIPTQYSALYYRSGGWGYSIQANSKLVFEVSVKFNNIGAAYYTAEVMVESWAYK